MRTVLVSIVALLLLPASAHAYLVPERQYWRHFTLQLINQSRTEHGLNPVGIDDELTELSQAHAGDTAVHFDDSSYDLRRSSYLAHESSDGRELGDRIREQAIPGLVAAGENVGFRYVRPFTQVHEVIIEALSFMHSEMMAEVPPDDGHRQTILGDFTHVGVGLELHYNAGAETNTLLLVTDFGKYTDGRLVRTPEVGPPPNTQPITAPPPVQEITPTPRRTRHIANSERVQPGRRPPVVAPRNPVAPPPTTSPISPPQSWQERSSARIAKRTTERLKRLLERRSQRRLNRLKRHENNGN